MTQRNIGRLNRLPFREVWRDEAREFTPWLRDHIDQLNQSQGEMRRGKG